MNIGALNKRLILQHSVSVADGMGAFTVTWDDAATVWGSIWPISANEMIQANAQAMIISHRIRIRYHSTLKASWRIKFENRYFNIISIINPNEANKYLDIMVKEVA
jgi:SPP1 family predicted phage head-tail adaptor